MKRIMIAGTHSGCGKTTVTCALLAALKRRGIMLSAFKCGPDYIDPMFHKTVLDVPSYNLDSVLMTEDTVRCLLKKHSSDLNIIEGVMGFYDGLSMTTEGSAFHICEITDTPVILVADCKGKGLSVLAEIQGYMEYRKNKIVGVIFNNLSDRLYAALSKKCKKVGIEPLGFMPNIKEAKIDSRHLGLITAAEINNIQQKISALAAAAEKTIDIERLIKLADSKEITASGDKAKKIADVKIAVAHDRAFCFYYDDNLELLRELGAEINQFSPLENEPVPECDGLILGGGYPELYADILEKNIRTQKSVKEKIDGGIPCIAECGGFMYLHEDMEDNNGKPHKMAGVISGVCKKTDRLQRFGYMEMTAQTDNVLCERGHKIKSREFHYFESNNTGNGFVAEKNGHSWDCVHANENLFAGFPHIHFYSDISLAQNFIKRCEKYKCTKQRN